MGNSIGFDIEFPLINKYTNAPVSAVGVIPGTKHKPAKTVHGYVHHDNVLAEIGAKPTPVPITFIKSVYNVLRDLQDIADQHDLIVGKSSYIAYPSSELNTLEATEVGCEPELCIYVEGLKVPALSAAILGNARTAGGHVHLDVKECTIDNVINIVKLCDIFLGTYNVATNPEGYKRRQFYGKAGSFRLKPYGIEYRVMDNSWALTKEGIATVGLLSEIIITKQGNSAAQLEYLRHFIDVDNIQNIINSHNVGEAANVQKFISEKYLKHKANLYNHMIMDKSFFHV